VGHVRVSFRDAIPRGGDLWLDFRGLAVDSVRVNGSVVRAMGASGAWDGQHVRLPARALQRDNAVDVTFRSPIAAAGASIIRARDVTAAVDYLYTLLVPSDAQLLFPCFDQPDLKARVTLTLVAPTGWRALANGPLLGLDSSRTAWEHRFAATEPISTYLIAFAAGPWTVITRDAVVRPHGPTVPTSLWVRASRAREVDADSLIAANTRALRWLGDWFGIDYPFKKYEFLLAPAFPFGGMEHPGAVFYNEESFIYREPPTANQLLGRQATIYHEVAHQWFGDYMTMQWFDDLWLKEGFATYMAAKMQAATDSAAQPWKSFYLRNKPVAYSTDATRGTTPVWQALANLDQAKSNYGPIVYNKAPSILRQLDFYVGEQAFQRGVRSFLAAHRYGNATWRELLAHIGRASGRDLASWGRAWILHPGLPVVEQRIELANGLVVRATLRQRPAQPTVSGANFRWPLRTRVLAVWPNGREEHFAVELVGAEAEIVGLRGRAAPRYIFANDGDFAYTLVALDTASVRALETDITSVRDDLRRAMLWGALWDAVRDAQFAPERFARLALRALPGERDEQLLASLIGRLSTSITRYTDGPLRETLRAEAEALFTREMAVRSRPYGQRKTFFDATIALARDSAALARIDGWLDADSVVGIPIRAPSRWAIVSRLIARRAPSAEARLSRESQRDSTTEGRRQAFAAQAGRADSAVKAQYFTQYFSDRAINEEWVTSSLSRFFDGEQSALTMPFVTAALDSLPWIQQNRRIFFLGSWIGAVLGGQQSGDALATVDGWLAARPSLAPDLRQKVLQSRDELERTVRIRTRFRL
jgi:aminopeptidase N